MMPGLAELLNIQLLPLGLTLTPNLIGLDSGCVWGGQLTAVCLEDRSVLQVQCPQFKEPGKKS